MAEQIPREQFSAWANIPARILFDREISDRAKLLYGLISCMSNSYGFAFAKNSTLMRYLNVEERSLQRTLKQLLDGGYIRIEDGSGGRGTLRKIFTVEICPRNPVNPDGVNPAKSDGVINNNCNNNKINNKARAPKAYLTDQELLDWFNSWAVRLDADPEETTKLIGDLHAFAEMRKAKKKPILTVNAAGRHAKKLLDYSADFPEYRLAAMRYVLSQSVESNWEKLYPITKPDDFNRWLHDNYGVQVGHVEPEVEYFE